MKSTISSAEMSIITPRARSCTMRCVRSSCSAIASRSCMSTWIDTSRQSPIFRIGISLMLLRLPARPRVCAVDHDLSGVRCSASAQRIRHGRLGNDVQLQAEMHDGLGDLRPDAAEDAVGAHQPRRGNRLDQMLRDQRIDRRHAGDVDDGDLGTGSDDALQQAFHDDLGPRAVERADQRQRQDAVPELTTGVDSSSSSCCWRPINSSRVRW